MADHILASSSLSPSNGTLGLAALDDDTVDWLQTIKQQHTASDETIGPNEEEDINLTNFRLVTILNCSVLL